MVQIINLAEDEKTSLDAWDTKWLISLFYHFAIKQSALPTAKS
jgi:hypothetical protein